MAARSRTCSFRSRASTAAHAAARSSAPSGRRAPGEHRKLALDEAGIDVAAHHLRMAHQRLQEGEIGRHALDLESGSARPCGRAPLPSVAGVHDQLRQQRIVMSA